MSFLNLHQPEKDLTVVSSSSSLSSLHNSEQRVFSCSYCWRKFYSPQAFGGHQNAHKLERTLAKKSQELSSGIGHNSEWNHMSSRFDSNGSSHVGPMRTSMVVEVQHEQRFDSRGKCEGVEDDYNHLDLSLRL